MKTKHTCFKTLLSLLLVLTMLLAMTGCGGSSSSEKTSAPDNASGNAKVEEPAATGGYWLDDSEMFDKITVAASSDGGSLYPGSARFGAVSLNIYQYLGVVNADGDLQLVLLKSVDKLSDTEYACELWDFIYDTNGVNMKASDIAYCMTRYLDVDGYKGAMNKLDHIEVTGDYTFTWHCSSPFDLGEMQKNFSGMPMFTQESFESTGSDEMTSIAIGTGPYKLEQYTPGSSVTLVANEDYWMKNITDEDWLAKNWTYDDAQNAKTIQVDIVSDASSRAIALEMGTVDAVDSLDIIDAENFAANESLGVDVYEIQIRGTVGLYFNCNELSACEDINLRKAICYAIDNVSYAAGNSSPSEPAYGLLPRMLDAPESWKTGEGRDYYTYSMETAKEYLEKSSYGGETLRILYNSNSASALADVAVMIQASLKDLGVNCELLPVDQSVLSTYKSDFGCWDIQMDTLSGGSNYMYAVLSRFWTEDSAMHMNGLQVTGVLDEHLDELYVALKDDNTEANVDAYDDYFTNEMCYGYGILCYNSTLGGQSNVQVAVTAKNNICPGAFVAK
ncbi:MAG: ABC transporter substrate-binding protein [Faecousia sp.]